MQSIVVHIKEKDKGSKNLTLLNLRDEVVNFLYRDTVANSTRADLQFFVLIYFASIKVKNKSFIEAIMDEALPKFDELNQAFLRKQNYLRANEYRQMVNEYGLGDIFYKDLFFVLCESILSIATIESKFSDVYERDSNLKAVIDTLKSRYLPRIEASFEAFKSSKIQDDRYDENGNYHDLSKSVYRTVRMRSSKNLELNLQKYTSVKKITSQSPVDLTFIQYIDPQIIFDLWDKYHVTEYMKPVWNFVNSPIGSSIIGGLVVKYWGWKSIDGNENRKEKRAAKEKFETEKLQHQDELNALNTKLVESVLNANTRLVEEIAELKKELARATSKELGAQDKDLIKKLEERIARLEGLEITTRVIDSEDRNDETTDIDVKEG